MKKSFITSRPDQCIYLDALQNMFTMGANTMNPDQTAHKGGD